jgi:hypothetical protein
MKARPRAVFAVVLACLATALVGVWMWLPWDPFEDDAGPLDAWVPADAEVVVRLDAGALQRSDLVRSLWSGAPGARFREALGLEGVLDSLRAADEALAGLPGVGDPPTVAADLLGREVLLAARDGDVLLLFRVSGRAKAIDLLSRADPEESGVEYDKETRSYTITEGDAAGIQFARRRDVLIFATVADLFDEALALADRGGEAITSNAAYRAAGLEPPDGARISAWATGPFVSSVTGELPPFAHQLQAAIDHPVRLDVDLTVRDTVKATARIAGDPTSLLDLSHIAWTAARFGGPAFARGALPLAAQDVVRALFDGQPPARRKLVDDLLAEKGSSADAVVRDVARHLADGVGFAVTRLRETDELRLDDAEGDVRIPVPATFAVFRLLDANADAFVADLRRHAEALFGENARFSDETFPSGTRLVRVADGATFGPEWELVHPAIVVSGEQVIFSSNETALLRALAAPIPEHQLTAGEALTIDLPRLRHRLLDLRWDRANLASAHDWAAEREVIRHEQLISGDARSADARRADEDAEIERRVRKRRDVEFPEAIREYVASVAWLDSFTRADIRIVPRGAGLVLEATVGVRVP